MANKKGTRVERDKGQLVAQGKDFEIFKTQRDAFEILRLKGRSTPEMLSWLRDKLLKDPRNLAIDAAGLAEANFPLARELGLCSRRYRNIGRHLVLLNARGPFRDLVRASNPDGSIAFVVSEQMLDGEVRNFVRRLADAKRHLSLIRTEVENNPAWQLVDREHCWMCPYCGFVQDFLRINPRSYVHDVQIEMIYVHLTQGCRPFQEEKGQKNMTNLVDALRTNNQDKMSASRTAATALATRVVELQGKVKEAEELEESVKIAGKRQRHLLPAEMPAIPGILAGLGYWPSQKLSGDFFDFQDLGDGRFAILIGDVSGHGIEAAVLMGVAKKVISIRIKDSGDPIMALQMANRDIYPDLDRMTFVSAFLGVYDAARMDLTYARAGHNPPIIYNPDRSPPFAKLEAQGLVLGLDPGPRFNHLLHRETVTLRQGDRFFLYTDGVVETQNKQGEEFELSRVYEQMRNQADSSPDDFIQTLNKRVIEFRQGLPQEDDVTAILMRWM